VGISVLANDPDVFVLKFQLEMIGSNDKRIKRSLCPDKGLSKQERPDEDTGEHAQ
jgi:hypothetical protein